MREDKTALHHIEICVQNETGLLKYFKNQLGFTVRGSRCDAYSDQWLLSSGLSHFIITKRKTSDPRQRPFLAFCCEDKNEHTIDSVFNVALEVKDVVARTNAIEKEGGEVLVRPTTVSDQCGSVLYSIVRSCVGNVVHTLLEKGAYHGPFLPTFEVLAGKDIMGEEADDLASTTHMDHVTFVCHPGESMNIVNWYSKCFGMRRFFTSRSEDPAAGLVIGEDIGMRLRAMEWWRCAETGIASDVTDASTPEVLRIVIAESLEEQENKHLASFLTHHKGPGLQHIGLHSKNIVKCVERLKKNGVRFREPPPTYYTGVGKLQDIEDTCQDLEMLKKLGVLIDAEADGFEPTGDQEQVRHLLQIFTFPIFSEETFFLEIIERRGARGFGSGNVAALARSIEAYHKK